MGIAGIAGIAVQPHGQTQRSDFTAGYCEWIVKVCSRVFSKVLLKTLHWKTMHAIGQTGCVESWTETTKVVVQQ